MTEWNDITVNKPSNNSVCVVLCLGTQCIYLAKYIDTKFYKIFGKFNRNKSDNLGAEIKHINYWHRVPNLIDK